MIFKYKNRRYAYLKKEYPEQIYFLLFELINALTESRITTFKLNKAYKKGL